MAQQRDFVIFAIDLDRFTRINGTLGRSRGDKLLCEVSARLVETFNAAPVEPTADLERHLSADAIVARLGANEFVAVIRRPEMASNLAWSVEAALAPSFDVAGAEVFVSSSIGVASYPEHGTNVDELLERAGAALDHAKACGGNNCQFFSTALVEKTRRRMVIESGLRAAMRRASGGTPFGSIEEPCATPELSLVYQPQVEVPANRMVGVEALVRWTSHELGPVSPAEFIPVAEETGLIVELGEWVLLTACSHAQSWAGPGQLNVSVNVSARQFHEPSFVRVVEAILEQTGLPPERLELELTENVVMPDPTTSRAVLQGLSELGVRIALDDFGTGYSSLSYLAKLPIDVLKIDRSFVTGMSGGKAGLITAAIIGLARGLELDIVVEGVETESQLNLLAEYGTLKIQGYYFAKPMPIEALTEWRPPRAHTPEESGVYGLPLGIAASS